VPAETRTDDPTEAVFQELLDSHFDGVPDSEHLRFLELLIGGTIAQAVVAPLMAIAIALTYFRLREAHDEPAAVPAET